MKLDNTFSREIKKINGDGSREAKFAFLNPTKQAAKELSTTQVSDLSREVLRKYGRASVGICVAATVIEREDRLEYETVQWAREVMRLWTNRPIDTGCVLIQDGLHPTKIEEYARSFIRATSNN
ncbi:hypothetical protein [Caproiciproducens sp.]